MTYLDSFLVSIVTVWFAGNVTPESVYTTTALGSGMSLVMLATTELKSVE